MWGSLGLVIIVVALFFVFARQSTSDGATASGQPAPQEIGAPDFQLAMYQGADVLGVNGEEVSFSSLFGQGKPVVLNFWAGLCPPCRAEMPGFQAVYEEMGDQFVLLGVDIGPFVQLGSREDGRALLRELGVTYPAATTFDGTVVTEYKIRGMPTTVFLTSEGEIFDTHAGLLTDSALRSKVQELLAASG